MKMKTNYSGLWIVIVLLLILVSCLSLVICLLILGFSQVPNDEEPQEAPISIPAQEFEFEPTVPIIKPVDFQPVIDSWAASVGGNRSVLVYDLDLDRFVGEYNPNEEYSTASLYKLFVVYQGYRNLQSGAWNPDDIAGWTGSTVTECLDLAIRESDSTCAEMMLKLIGRDDLQSIMDNVFGMEHSSISGYYSTPRDILNMMKIFYEHKDITNQSLISQMKDSFLNQPVTIYDWRQGLPSGFSRAEAYNKVGWEYNPDAGRWDIYNDAAIVEFPENDRHFVVVVMTNGVSFTQIARLGAMLEESFYNQNSV